MSSRQEQFHSSDQDGGQYHTTASDMTRDPAQSRGTSVMGEPTNPSSQPSTQRYNDNSAQYGSANQASDGSYVSPSSGDARAASAPFSGQQASAAQQYPSADGGSQPYVQTTNIPGGTNKTPMDTIMQVFNKWGKKAEDVTGNVWGHLRTGPNVADTAFGRIAVVSKAMAEGGMENVYRQAFDVAPDEHLLKSYACYLSTSTGPVAGTLYISTHKLAFCSDRPLVIPGSSTPAGQTAASDNKVSAAQQQTQQQQQQQQWVYYKVAVPTSQLQSVHPTENMQKKPPEKYIQIKTVDGHDFWFMGFVNYDKGVKNLQNVLAAKESSGPGDMPPDMDPAEAAAMAKIGKTAGNTSESTSVGYTPFTSKNPGEMNANGPSNYNTGYPTANTDDRYNARHDDPTPPANTYQNPASATTAPPPSYDSVH